MEEYRGKGIMGTELRDSFTYFFTRGFKNIVLETSDERNLPIYQKIGFKIEEVIAKKSTTLYFLKYEKRVE